MRKTDPGKQVKRAKQLRSSKLTWKWSVAPFKDYHPPYTLGLQIAQSRSYLYFRPKVGIIYILGRPRFRTPGQLCYENLVLCVLFVLQICIYIYLPNIYMYIFIYLELFGYTHNFFSRGGNIDLAFGCHPANTFSSETLSGRLFRKCKTVLENSKGRNCVFAYRFAIASSSSFLTSLPFLTRLAAVWSWVSPSCVKHQ